MCDLQRRAAPLRLVASASCAPLMSRPSTSGAYSSALDEYLALAGGSQGGQEATSRLAALAARPSSSASVPQHHELPDHTSLTPQPQYIARRHSPGPSYSLAPRHAPPVKSEVLQDVLTDWERLQARHAHTLFKARHVTPSRQRTAHSADGPTLPWRTTPRTSHRTPGPWQGSAQPHADVLVVNHSSSPQSSCAKTQVNLASKAKKPALCRNTPPCTYHQFVLSVWYLQGVRAHRPPVTRTIGTQTEGLCTCSGGSTQPASTQPQPQLPAVDPAALQQLPALATLLQALSLLQSQPQLLSAQPAAPQYQSTLSGTPPGSARSTQQGIGHVAGRTSALWPAQAQPSPLPTQTRASIDSSDRPHSLLGGPSQLPPTLSHTQQPSALDTLTIMSHSVAQQGSVDPVDALAHDQGLLQGSSRELTVVQRPESRPTLPALPPLLASKVQQHLARKARRDVRARRRAAAQALTGDTQGGQDQLSEDCSSAGDVSD